MNYRGMLNQQNKRRHNIWHGRHKKEIHCSVKENVKSKFPYKKKPENMSNHEKTKPKNDRVERKSIIPTKRHRKYTQ